MKIQWKEGSEPDSYEAIIDTNPDRPCTELPLRIYVKKWPDAPEILPYTNIDLRDDLGALIESGDSVTVDKMKEQAAAHLIKRIDSLQERLTAARKALTTLI